MEVYFVVPLELGYILMKPKIKVLFFEITMPHNCDVKNKFSEETYLGILILKSSGHHCIHKTWLLKMQATIIH